MTIKTEQTPEGMQALIPGVDPLAPVDPLVAERVARDEKRKRNQHKAGGLFDDGALAQSDLADFIAAKVEFIHVK